MINFLSFDLLRVEFLICTQGKHTYVACALNNSICSFCFNARASIKTFTRLATRYSLPAPINILSKLGPKAVGSASGSTPSA